MNEPSSKPQSASQELEPARGPLSLPPDFDQAKYPHYSVQSSIYSLLLSALSMAEHYERMPGAQARQDKLDEVVKDYLSTCELIRLNGSQGQPH